MCRISGYSKEFCKQDMKDTQHLWGISKEFCKQDMKDTQHLWGVSKEFCKQDMKDTVPNICEGLVKKFKTKICLRE